MKKTTLLVLTLGAAASLSVVGCSSSTIDLAMITDVGQIDDGSFNQYTYAGVTSYAADKGLKQAYFRPTEDSPQARIDSIDAAVKRGAKVVVCPGYLFETAIYQSQETYPDVSFLLLDGQPHSDNNAIYKTESNVHCILYKEYEPGYLAGYAAVEEGYTKLGFMGGMAVPAVEKYGFGYVSGIIDAANKKNVNVSIQYDYAGTFNASDAIVTTTTGWYNGGTEVVFSCGGSIFKSVSSAATSTSKKVIGVDVDQYSQAKSVVITSAEKKLQESTYAALDAYYTNTTAAWPTAIAGKTSLVGAKEGMIGLPTEGDSWTFKNFTKDQYNTLFAAMAADENFTGVTFDTTVKLAAKTDLTHLTITYGSGVTNRPIADA